VVGCKDAYWASGRSAVTNSLLLSVLWAVGTCGADRNVQHWAEPQRSAGVGNSTIGTTNYSDEFIHKCLHYAARRSYLDGIGPGDIAYIVSIIKNIKDM
jgi:hypothetical protein